jgi:hypothetical protein
MRTIGGAAPHTNLRVLMRELVMAPAGHYTVKSCCRFWNKVMSLPFHSVLKQAFLEDLKTAWLSGGNDKRRWGSSMLKMLHCMAADVYHEIGQWAEGCGEGLVNFQHSLCVHGILDAWHNLWMDDWCSLPENPRVAPSHQIKMCTHAKWMGLRDNAQQQCNLPICLMTAKDKEGTMPEYLVHSGFMKQQLFRDLHHFRTGTHWLAVEKQRYGPLRADRQLRVCTLCSAREVEDEHHMIFVCPAYDGLRQGEFTDLFEDHLRADVIPDVGSDDMVRFLQQNPNRVAAFITACRRIREYMLSTAMQEQQQQQQQQQLPISSFITNTGDEDSIEIHDDAFMDDIQSVYNGLYIHQLLFELADLVSQNSQILAQMSHGGSNG